MRALSYTFGNQNINREIIPEVKLVPKAQPRDTNNLRILSALAAIGRKHILMARSVAEGPNYFKIRFKILKFGQIAANYHLFVLLSPIIMKIIHLSQDSSRGAAEGY